MVHLEDSSLIRRQVVLKSVYEMLCSLVHLVGRKWVGRLGRAGRSRQRVADSILILIDDRHGGMTLALESSSQGPTRQAEDPCREWCFSTKRVDGGENIDKDFLGRFLRIGVIAQALVEEGIDSLEVAVVEVVEGFAVALSYSVYEDVVVIEDAEVSA